VKDEHEMFGEVVVGVAFCRPQPADVHMKLNDIGKIVENEIMILSHVYQNVFVDKYVVMPNHVHMIICIRDDGWQNAGDGNHIYEYGRCAGDHGRQNAAPTVSRIIQ